MICHLPCCNGRSLAQFLDPDLDADWHNMNALANLADYVINADAAHRATEFLNECRGCGPPRQCAEDRCPPSRGGGMGSPTPREAPQPTGLGRCSAEPVCLTRKRLGPTRWFHSQLNSRPRYDPAPVRARPMVQQYGGLHLRRTSDLESAGTLGLCPIPRESGPTSFAEPEAGMAATDRSGITGRLYGAYRRPPSGHNQHPELDWSYRREPSRPFHRSLDAGTAEGD